MTNDEKSGAPPRAGVGSGDRPPQLRPRTIGFLLLFWTALMIAWFLSVAADGSLPSPALAVVVGGFIGVIWLLGLLILGLFLVRSDE